MNLCLNKDVPEIFACDCLCIILQHLEKLSHDLFTAGSYSLDKIKKSLGKDSSDVVLVTDSLNQVAMGLPRKAEYPSH